MMILHMCIVYDPRKHHFDFGFKGQGLGGVVCFFGGVGEVKMSNVNARFVICILQCFCTIIISPFDIWYSDDISDVLPMSKRRHFWVKRSRSTCSNLKFWTLHHFHTENVVSLLYFDIQWLNFTYDAMFSMTSRVPLLTVELKDPRYIVKLEVKMLDITLHLYIMKLHKYMLSVTWEWFQLILGSKTQIKESMKSLIFFTTARGGGGW